VQRARRLRAGEDDLARGGGGDCFNGHIEGKAQNRVPGKRMKWIKIKRPRKFCNFRGLKTGVGARHTLFPIRRSLGAPPSQVGGRLLDASSRGNAELSVSWQNRRQDCSRRLLGEAFQHGSPIPCRGSAPHMVVRPLRHGLVTAVLQVGPRELPPERWPDGTGLASYPSIDI
jgi:hypothetical protein